MINRLRQIRVHQLESLLPLAFDFSGLAGIELNQEAWLDNWRRLIDSGTGVIFAIKKELEPIGVIGGVFFNDINTGKRVAAEFFWFVKDGARGDGMKLLKRFELWAKENNCQEIMMVHLSNSMPGSLKKLYERLGYREIETQYKKEI
jgi:GNAT superfamily N-acetyltransferase